VNDIPVNWTWIEAETQATGWVDYEDARPLDTAPLLDALAEGREASKERALDAS
jgi:uncharacterized membrane-anchored protein